MEQLLPHLASRSRRLAAYLIDILPILLIMFGIFYFFFDFDDTLERYLNRGDDIEPRKEFLRQRNWIRELSFLTWLIYCIFMEASDKQGTLGKQLLGIKVVDEQGRRLSLSQSAGRNLRKIVSYILFFIGFIWILFDKKRQGLHDKYANTYVVNRKFEPAGTP